MAQDENRFRHDTLDLNEPSAIRLLQVSPRTTDGHIECHMVHATTGRDYTCLSYMWGYPTPLHEVRMNGKTMLIRKNLFQFLAHVSSVPWTEPTRQYLWIDALCIDQVNEKEKNHQVQQMGNIYSQAREVLIWLGILPTRAAEINTFLDQANKHARYTEHPGEVPSIRNAMKEVGVA